MRITRTLSTLLVALPALAFAQSTPVAKIIPDDKSAPVAQKNRELIEAGLLGGGTVSLPGGAIYLDRAVLLNPLHSGGTLVGRGDATVLRNATATGLGVNATLSAGGTGVGYAHNAELRPGGAALIVAANDGDGRPHDLSGFRPGNVVYGFRWNVYGGPRARYIIRAFDSTTRKLELDRKPDPALLTLKWVDGAALADCREGDRAVKLAVPSDANTFPPGRRVYVTDGPTVANEANGEFRRVLNADPATGRVTLDAPLLRGYTLPALARVQSVEGLTLSRLTLAQPAHPDAGPFFAKWCVSLNLDRVQLGVPGEATARSGLASCGFVTLKECRIDCQLDLNTTHDLLIDGGKHAGIVAEEACSVSTIRNATIAPAGRPMHGILWYLGSDRLTVERCRVEGGGAAYPAGGAVAPLSFAGRGCVVRDVVIAKSVNVPGLSASWLAGDGLLVQRLTSDLPVNITGGTGVRLENSKASGWVLHPGTGGILQNCTPAPNPLPKGWTPR